MLRQRDEKQLFSFVISNGLWLEVSSLVLVPGARERWESSKVLRTNPTAEVLCFPTGAVLSRDAETVFLSGVQGRQVPGFPYTTHTTTPPPKTPFKVFLKQ